MSQTKIKLNCCFKTSYMSKQIHCQQSSFHLTLYKDITYMIWDSYHGGYAVCVSQCSPVHVYQHLRQICCLYYEDNDHDDGYSRFISNICTHLPDYKLSHPTQQTVISTVNIVYIMTFKTAQSNKWCNSHIQPTQTSPGPETAAVTPYFHSSSHLLVPSLHNSALPNLLSL